MKRMLGTVAILAVLGISYSASAHDMSKHAAGAPKHASTSVTGEVVDAGCFLGHAARGKDHADCAKQCIEGGMPMFLVTKQGTVYLLTMNHDNSDPYNKLKKMAGKTVVVTGTVMTRGAMKGIDVASIKPTAV